MTEGLVCDYCGEELTDEPIRSGGIVYCSDACAFEAGRSKDCGGRTDSTFTDAIIEMPEPPQESELG
jgi:hypothetical protein